MKWPVVPLSNALGGAEVFVDGDWVESKDQDPDGDVRLVQLADVGDGGYINKSSRFSRSAKARELRCTFLKPGDLLVARMPDPLGRVCIFPGNSKPSVTVVDVCIIRPVSGELDARWLMHCLNAPFCRSQIAGYATGTTRSRISRSNLGRIKIALPPVPEQRRIAAVLDRAEALRAKRRAALAQLDTLTQSIFLDMFGDPAINPIGWPIKTLEQICQSVADIDHKMPATVNDGVPFISAKDLTDDGRISFENVKRISEVDFRRLSRKSKPERGDIVYSRIGVNLGKARIVEVDFDFLASYSCCTIKPNRSLVETTYLCALLDSPFILRQAHKGVRAIAVPDLGMGEIKGFKIILPPIDLQSEFARRVINLEKMKVTYRASLAELETLFASLQHRAFRGEL